MFCEECGEGGEVAGFLGVHVVHEGAEMGVGFEYRWGLGGVDQGGGEFAGVVDS